jgi:hypothetical protein
MRFPLNGPPHERRDNHCACLNITVSSLRIDSQGSLETAYILKLDMEKMKKIMEKRISWWLAGIR